MDASGAVATHVAIEPRMLRLRQGRPMRGMCRMMAASLPPAPILLRESLVRELQRAQR